MTSASELLARVKARPAWDEVSIFRADTQYPCLHLAWQPDCGFIFHCFEDAGSSGYFAVESAVHTLPEVEIDLGGQALERWPRRLFVSDHVAREAVEYFLRTGKRRNAVYYWDSLDTLKQFSRHPTHLEAKRQNAKWYDGHHIVAPAPIDTRARRSNLRGSIFGAPPWHVHRLTSGSHGSS